MESRIENNQTIYKSDDGTEFRIVQLSDIHFQIEKKVAKLNVTGFMFWQKKKEHVKWKKTGEVCGVITTFPALKWRYKYYTSIEEAKKWLYDYDKYPIIH